MVGDILRKAREKQGLTIADIEEGTSIRKLYIEHIERGNIDALPGMVYAKGFVRNYAAFLHLDAEHLVQQFAEENGAPPAPVPAVSATNRSPRYPLAGGDRPTQGYSASLHLASLCWLRLWAAVQPSFLPSILRQRRRLRLRRQKRSNLRRRLLLLRQMPLMPPVQRRRAHRTCV